VLQIFENYPADHNISRDINHKWMCFERQKEQKMKRLYTSSGNYIHKGKKQNKKLAKKFVKE